MEIQRVSRANVKVPPAIAVSAVSFLSKSRYSNRPRRTVCCKIIGTGRNLYRTVFKTVVFNTNEICKKT